MEEKGQIAGCEMKRGYKDSNTPEAIKDLIQTPPYIFEFAWSVLGGIDFDTACNSENQLSCPVWWGLGGKGDDALSVEWRGKLFCNPPYSNVVPWIDHAIACKDAITAMLLPSPNGDSYCDKLIENSHEIHIIGRIAFISPADFFIKGKNGKPDKQVKKGDPLPGNNRGSSLFIINGYSKGTRSFVYRDVLIKEFG